MNNSLVSFLAFVLGVTIFGLIGFVLFSYLIGWSIDGFSPIFLCTLLISGFTLVPGRLDARYTKTQGRHILHIVVTPFALALAALLAGGVLSLLGRTGVTTSFAQVFWVSFFVCGGGLVAYLLNTLSKSVGDLASRR